MTRLYIILQCIAITIEVVVACRHNQLTTMLYVLQNLQKVETYCQQQMKASEGINALHFEDLLREIKLIRERRTTVK